MPAGISTRRGPWPFALIEGLTKCWCSKCIICKCIILCNERSPRNLRRIIPKKIAKRVAFTSKVPSISVPVDIYTLRDPVSQKIPSMLLSLPKISTGSPHWRQGNSDSIKGVETNSAANVRRALTPKNEATLSLWRNSIGNGSCLPPLQLQWGQT